MEIEQAKAALDQAQQSEAREYAPEALQTVNQKWEALQTELQAQEEKMAFRRNYDQAKVMIAEVQAEAQKAETAGTQAKEQLRVEVTQALQNARVKIDEVKLALENAPRGKGTAADLKMMEQDVAELETNLASAQQLHDAGQYRPAMNKLRTLMASANDTQTAIETATTMQAKAAGR
jgi:hypothetical protein